MNLRQSYFWKIAQNTIFIWLSDAQGLINRINSFDTSLKKTKSGSTINANMSIKESSRHYQLILKQGKRVFSISFMA